ncbi:MAG: ESX-1 secretion-associated protein [Mycobacteriaceae bacterium]|nr:ESX-1 secretion-associated protein [Mycobacteriaceae bacterium]
MPELTVDPAEFERAAACQEQAAEQASQGAEKTAHLGSRLRRTHGAISDGSTSALTRAEKERHAAGYAIRDACLRLAAILRAGGETYEQDDHAVAQNYIHTQLHD